MSNFSPASALKLLTKYDVLIGNGHFVYTSGKHGDTYLNKDALLPHVELISQICEQIAEQFVGMGVEVVLGPVAGGVVMSQWVAYHLGRLEKSEVLAMYADKRKDGELLIRRRYDVLAAGKKILLVDDIINLGTSLRGLLLEVDRIRGNVVGVGCLCNRYSSKAEDFSVPKLYGFIDFRLNIYDPAECPLCKAGVPLSKGLGHA